MLSHVEQAHKARLRQFAYSIQAQHDRRLSNTQRFLFMKRKIYKFLEKGGWIPVCLVLGFAYVFIFEDIILESFWNYIFDITFAKSEKLVILLILLLLAIQIYVIGSSISKRCKVDPDYKAKIEKELKPFLIPAIFVLVVALILMGSILLE